MVKSAKEKKGIASIASKVLLVLAGISLLLTIAFVVAAVLLAILVEPLLALVGIGAAVSFAIFCACVLTSFIAFGSLRKYTRELSQQQVGEASERHIVNPKNVVPAPVPVQVDTLKLAFENDMDILKEWLFGDQYLSPEAMKKDARYKTLSNEAQELLGEKIRETHCSNITSPSNMWSICANLLKILPNNQNIVLALLTEAVRMYKDAVVAKAPGKGEYALLQDQLSLSNINGILTQQLATNALVQGSKYKEQINGYLNDATLALADAVHNKTVTEETKDQPTPQ